MAGTTGLGTSPLNPYHLLIPRCNPIKAGLLKRLWLRSRATVPTPTATETKTAWQGVLRKARIEDLHFHDLRHTFVSHFAMKGGNLYALAKIVGAQQPEMTLDRHAHLAGVRQRAAAGDGRTGLRSETRMRWDGRHGAWLRFSKYRR
jgi:integrase